ncbi:purine-nucleoside phosphorylase [Candidatus Woesearchaeota archaeon]|nr:purine-nucleoside phosphorylase [Candidatus Woesearchaeota archaeon]
MADELEKTLLKAYEFQRAYETHVSNATAYIKNNLLRERKQPLFGLVLGSGLGDLADALSDKVSMDYAEIPSFPRTTVAQHAGTLHSGELEGVPVLCLKGRKHYYEVADLPFNNGILQAVFPVHVLAELGVRNYFATNAAGGLNPKFEVGTLMVIHSHINGGIPNPLLGKQHNFKRADGENVWRFQPMNNAYDKELRTLLYNACAETVKNEEQTEKTDKVKTSLGTYLAVTGPSYETEAECLAFKHGWGADAVGMSTVPEVIIARNRGMKAVGMSCITNVIASDGTNATNHEEVAGVLNSKKVRGRLTNSVLRFFHSFKKTLP